jgi:hypothetical protein
MRKLILSTLALFIAIVSNCQDKIIAGQVLDSLGSPLIGVSVCQKNSNNCNITDFNGAFHILINRKLSETIVFSAVGFENREISIVDTVEKPLIVRMEENIEILDEDIVMHSPYPSSPSRFGFVSYIKVDYLPTDFTDFESVLSDYNIVAMNRADGTINFELGGIYKRYYLGLNFGYVFGGDDDHDTLDIEFNYTQYGLNFGFNLINSKRFLIQPKANIAWNRYRLINNDKERKITIGQYVTDRDLDIRFNQLTGFVGLNFAYKMYNHNVLSSDYWTIGIYGGYLYKLNDKPWIYSKRNRLDSDGKIKINNYNVGFYFSFNID